MDNPDDAECPSVINNLSIPDGWVKNRYLNRYQYNVVIVVVVDMFNIRQVLQIA
jgi:hypothetical protein